MENIEKKILNFLNEKDNPLTLVRTYINTKNFKQRIPSKEKGHAYSHIKICKPFDFYTYTDHECTKDVNFNKVIRYKTFPKEGIYSPKKLNVLLKHLASKLKADEAETFYVATDLTSHHVSEFRLAELFFYQSSEELPEFYEMHRLTIYPDKKFGQSLDDFLGDGNIWLWQEELYFGYENYLEKTFGEGSADKIICG